MIKSLFFSNFKI